MIAELEQKVKNSGGVSILADIGAKERRNYGDKVEV
jgi:hypothetical protein